MNSAVFLGIVTGEGRGDGSAATTTAAQEITYEAGRELVRAAESVISQLDIAGEDFHLVLSGGLWKAVPGVRNEVSKLLPKIAPRVKVEKLQVEPAAGAVQLALEALS